ncbi:fluoride efflux transporter CrcB [Polynucleobacter sp. MWH-Spelu-300-X4]|uniref:fluoride efflux transporter CrcB n=1 Tax=Polynucleobacter sp. MWH-Spelu-300-X4 TaxID=2689109 RepID=UPI001BFDD35C|nr:fluoride efflux transporter CrcB [Polynucleobacter sp. MWH-Spelu-300-X4]QWD80210.1 fluoride efflux transporter CrcB [Polynucleobacter sp. MWH-Spelu-300-X4]
MLQSIIAISIGAAVGAVSRWLLALGLNAIWAAMPLGTLAANLIGGYLVGLASSFFGAHADLPIELRLLVITGFLGGLTTFSTFSAEVIEILQSGAYVRAFLTIGLHLLGSLALTILGIASYGWFK